MHCKNCMSESVQRFDGELTLSLANLNGLNIPPVYVCECVIVCLQCGFTELVIPRPTLGKLNQGKAALTSS
jgi:hypothetical protein